MTAADYVGIATLITAAGAAVTSAIVAIRQASVKATIENTNAQVQSPGDATIGETIAHIHEKVCDE